MTQQNYKVTFLIDVKSIERQVNTVTDCFIMGKVKYCKQFSYLPSARNKVNLKIYSRV